MNVIIRTTFKVERLREAHGGPRSGGEAMSEAKPGMCRPCEAGARPNLKN
jgi:hypothetical protein